MNERPETEKWQITVPSSESQMLKKLAGLAGTAESAMGARAISEWLRANYRELIDLYSNR